MVRVVADEVLPYMIAEWRKDRRRHADHGSYPIRSRAGTEATKDKVEHHWLRGQSHRHTHPPPGSRLRRCPRTEIGVEHPAQRSQTGEQRPLFLTRHAGQDPLVMRLQVPSDPLC